MKFQHLLEVNNSLDAQVFKISASQLWCGLVLRAREPTLFLPHMDECLLHDVSALELRRSLRYGELTIKDRVILTPHEQVRYLVTAQQDMPASSLCMTIVLTPSETLSVRFEYDDGHNEAQDRINAPYNDFRRSAYLDADINTVEIIRQLAAQGRL